MVNIHTLLLHVSSYRYVVGTVIADTPTLLRATAARVQCLVFGADAVSVSDDAQRRERSSRWWPPLLVLTVFVAVFAWDLVGFGGDDFGAFCTADGRLGPNGQIYSRDPAQNCQFADDNGNLLPDP